MSDSLPTKPGSSTPAVKLAGKAPAPARRRDAADLFLEQATAADRAEPSRVIMAIDATGSREATWDAACCIQADMFKAVATGGLQVQLVAFLGGLQLYGGGTVLGMVDGTPTVAGGEPVDKNPARLLTGPKGPTGEPAFTSSSEVLDRLMRKITCKVGYSQIERVLRHALDTHRKTAIKGVVVIGDMFEENIESVLAVARELGRAQVKVFMFQEGDNAKARKAFEAIAAATEGAYAPFSDGSADQLRDLLKALAVFAVSGVEGLKAMVGATDKTAALPAAAVLLSCLTGTRAPKSDDEPIDIDYSVPVKGPRPKSPMTIIAEASGMIITAIEKVKTVPGEAFLRPALAAMDEATKAVDAAMKAITGLPAVSTDDAGEMIDDADELAKLAQALAHKTLGEVADEAQALAYKAHAHAMLLRSKSGQ